MLQDKSVTDPKVLDFLELFNSTVEPANRLGISQGSCSRRRRTFSELFGIGFDRIADQYQALSNFDVFLAWPRHRCQVAASDVAGSFSDAEPWIL
jgi:hypothetical protein